MAWENEQEKVEAIEAWLRSELSGDQLADFEAQLKEDAQFAEEVDIHRKLAQHAVDPELDAFEKGVREMLIRKRPEGAEKSSTTGETRRFPYRMWAIAAAVVVLVALTGWMLNRVLNPKMEPEQVFAEHYQEYPMVITIESGGLVRGPEDSIRLQESEIAYRTGNYEAAYLGFSNLRQEAAFGADLNFYFGMSALETDHYPEGKEAFESVLEDPESLFAEAAHWYLGLLQLKSGDIDAAQAIFTSIAESEGSYQARAKDILTNFNALK